MTPEQIEAQRKKFEKKHPVPENIRWTHNDYYKFDRIEWVDDVINYRNLFRGWLSAIESNEIELPKESVGANTEFLKWLADYIEKQGFKVKV